MAAYSEVDLPEPVGPVTRMQPYGFVNDDSNRSSVGGRKPRSLSSSRIASLRRIRKDDALTVHGGKRGDAEVHLVTGDGDSAVAILWFARLGDVELGHDLEARDDRGLNRLGAGCMASCRTPSMRNLTRRSCSCGSMWMSDARSATAFWMMKFTSLTAGASLETSVSLSRSSSDRSSVPRNSLLAQPRLRDSAHRCGEDVVFRRDRRLDVVAGDDAQIVQREHVLWIGHRHHDWSPRISTGISV